MPVKLLNQNSLKIFKALRILNKLIFKKRQNKKQKECHSSSEYFLAFLSAYKEKNMRDTKWQSVEKTEKNAKYEKLKKSGMDSDVLDLLFSRGIDDEEKIEKFLNPSLEDIGNPLGFADMEKTALEIEKAIKEQKNIWIYGDYDVDGITSTSVLCFCLKELGAKNVNYYIPLREEGYGLNCKALQKIKDDGGELVITVDCGITGFEEAEFAKSINLPMIITDHHNLFEDRLPEAIAVIEPKRKDNAFPFTMLAGVGTIFMVMMYMYERAGMKEKVFELIDLVGLGTIADVVPLVEENRIFTKFGLVQLAKTKNLGLKVLLEKLFPDKTDGNFESDDVGFKIAPLFNAAGRLEDAKIVMELLLSEDREEIEGIVEKLISLNEKRKEMQNEIAKKIEEKLEDKNIEDIHVIVDASPEYHHGVLGIVASKIVDKYYRPTIVMEIKEDEGVAVGSCRSIDGFNLLEALQSMPELFTKFGGHSGAAGLSIPIENIDEFKKRINEFAKEKMTPEILLKTVKYDKVIPMQKINYGFFKSLENLKPFGEGNRSPVFRINNVSLENARLIGKTKEHVMYNAVQKDFSIRNCVWFGSSDVFKELLEIGSSVDIVFEMKNEMYQDEINTKIFTIDIKSSEKKKLTDLFYWKSLFETSFPMKSIFYVSESVKTNKQIKTKENEIFKINNGLHFAEPVFGEYNIGFFNANDSKILQLLNEKFNWKFKARILSIIKTQTNDIAEVLVERNYSFEKEIGEKDLFKEIKLFLNGKLPYGEQTKFLLSKFFKEKKSIIIKDNENSQNNLLQFILTLGIYFKKMNGKKSQIVVKDTENFKYNIPFVKEYFDINEKKKAKYPFTFFVDTLPAKNIKEQFVALIYDEKLKGKVEKFENAEIAENRFEIYNERIRFVDQINDEEKRKINKNNLYLEYLPIEEKIKVKTFFDKGEEIYCDYSITEIM